MSFPFALKLTHPASPGCHGFAKSCRKLPPYLLQRWDHNNGEVIFMRET
jgi:hypothetical protein